jgi:WD40 repeat protein
VCLWDAETGEQVWVVLRGEWDPRTFEHIPGRSEGHVKGVLSVRFSHDGRYIASSSYDMTVKVWDAKTGAKVAGPFKGHTSWTTCVAFSPDSKHIASGSLDKTVRVWDIETGKLVFNAFEGHHGKVSAVMYSPDGKSIVSSSYDGTIRVWGPLDEEDDHTDPTRLIMGSSKMIKGGWMCGTHSEMLFWVPPENRGGLWRRNTAVIGKHTTKLDLRKFVHGTTWENCHI